MPARTPSRTLPDPRGPDHGPASGPTPSEADARRDALLDAALELLQAQGYRDTTMLQVATRARASKHTVYRHFPSKEALFASLAERAAWRINDTLASALAADAAVPETLERFGESLLRLLTGPVSVAINRAAIAEAPSAPEIARALAQGGRDRTGALVVRYLQQRIRAGELRRVDPADAFETFVGLLVGDLQVRLLAGNAAPPDAAQCRRRARVATERFVALFGAAR